MKLRFQISRLGGGEGVFGDIPSVGVEGGGGGGMDTLYFVDCTITSKALH